MTDLDLEAMVEVARAATPGEWHVEQDVDSGQKMVCNDASTVLCDVAEWSRWLGNAEHVATFDPPTVLALIERARVAEAAAVALARDLVAAVATIARVAALAEELAHPDVDLIVAFERAVHRNIAYQLRAALATPADEVER